MDRITLADALDQAAERLDGNADQALAALLRNAALLIRNASTIALDADVDFALTECAAEWRIAKETLIRNILTQWVDKHDLSAQPGDAGDVPPAAGTASPRKH